MFKITVHKWLTSALLCCALSSPVLHAADSPVIVGKDDWLFISYEFATPADAPDTEATLQLLQKANALFKQSGIALAVAIVPSKIRIHQQFLPADKALDSYTNEKYDNAVKALRAGGVNVVDLNQAFMSSANRSGENPLFLRLDTHWSATGALLAAETIKKSIDATPALSSALAATPAVKFSLSWSDKRATQRARDLFRLLPKEAQTYGPEQALTFKVSREQASGAGLLGGDEKVGITVIGSSYTNKNTGYPDGLRYTLQRELLDISIPVDQGPWVGMEAYLRNDAFKTNKPKLIIWEIPERELRSPPNYKFRDARYVIDNAEWLQRITGLIK